MTWFVISGWILLLAYLILLAWYRYWWKKIPAAANRNFSQYPMISILIPARNEEQNLPACLESLLAQDYPADRFEILVIDDHSEDGTATVAAQFANTKVLSLSDYTDTNTISYKKRAITLGINNASGELIVTTDADCKMGRSWLCVLAFEFTNNPEVVVVAGPVSLIPATERGWASRVFYRFQQVDFLMYQGITGAGIRGRLHHLCNGANFAYTRSSFHVVSGFSGNEKQPSGDDIFLMQKLVKRYPSSARYLKSRDAIVYTLASENIRNFIQQRIRWAGKSSGYAEKTILPIMLLVFLVNLFMLFLCFACFLSPNSFIVRIPLCYHLLGAILIKIFSESLLFCPVSRFFQQAGAGIYLVVLQPFHIAYTVSTAFLSFWGNYHWKGRKYQKKDLK